MLEACKTSHESETYLLRMATTGFIRAACEAGMIPANTPTTIQMPIESSMLEVETNIGKSKNNRDDFCQCEYEYQTDQPADNTEEGRL